MADELDVEFDEAVQSLEALNAAAYRVLDAANCTVERRGGKLVCRLTPKGPTEDREAIRSRFLDCVTDENLRQILKF